MYIAAVHVCSMFQLLPPDIFCARIDEVKMILHPESGLQVPDIINCNKIIELIAAKIFVMKAIGKQAECMALWHE